MIISDAYVVYRKSKQGPHNVYVHEIDTTSITPTYDLDLAYLFTKIEAADFCSKHEGYKMVELTGLFQ